MAGLCGWALSSSCPPLGRAPELCHLWLGPVAGPCPPLALNPVNSVAGLSNWALWLGLGWALWLGLVLLLSSSWPRWAL